MSDTTPPPVDGVEDGPATGGRWRLVVGIALAVIFLAVIALAAASAFIDPRMETATHQAPAIILDLRAPGSVEILPADGDTISVDKQIRDVWGRARTSETVEGDTLQVESRCANRWIVFLGDCQVDYQIRAPAMTAISGTASNGTVVVQGMRATLDLTTSNGDMEALDLEGAVHLRTSNGEMQIRGVTGAVIAETSNGSIVVDNITSQDGIEVTSSNGDLTVMNTTGNLTLDTDNGDIEVSGVQADQVSATSSNGLIAITFDNNPELVTAESDNDDVDIELPADAPAYAIELSTTNGTTEVNDIVDDPSAPLRIEVTTDNGDITVGHTSEG